MTERETESILLLFILTGGGGESALGQGRGGRRYRGVNQARSFFSVSSPRFSFGRALFGAQLLGFVGGR